MAGSAKLNLILALQNKIKGGLDQAKKQIDKATGGMSDKLNSFKKSNIKAFEAIKDEIPGVARALDVLSNPYIILTGVVLALGAAYYKSVNMALDWQSGLAKINVTAGLTQKELSGLSTKLLDIGKNNVADIETIPDAFNKIISAGLDVDTSLKVLEPSLMAAKAGFVDVGIAADAAVNVMNSSGEDINKVYDTLFMTLNKGKAEFQDIAQYLPKIIPGARQAGLSLGETAGAWAFLTAQGKSAEQATTLSQNAFKSLTDPSKINAFKKMGINIFDATGKIKPLTNIIDQLTSKTKGLTNLDTAKFYGNLGLDQEAAAFFASATQDAKKFKEIINSTVNSQGSLNKAYNDALTPMDNWKIVSNKVKGAMIEIGQKALPIISKMGFAVLNFINYWKDLYKNSEMFRDIISGIGWVLGWAFKIAVIPIMRVWNLIKGLGSMISWAISKIPGFGGGFSGAYHKIRPYLVWIKQMLNAVATLLYDLATFNFTKIGQDIKNIGKVDINVIKKQQLVTDNKETNKAKQAAFTDNMLKDYAAQYAKVKPGSKFDTERKAIKDKMEYFKKGSSAGVNDENNNGIVDSKETKKLEPTATDNAKTIGSGSQSKVTNIRIGSFIEKYDSKNAEINSMSKDEVERWFMEMFNRMLVSVELT